MAEVIVKYNGPLTSSSFPFETTVELLNANYAIVTLPQERIPDLYGAPQIEYVELPKEVLFNRTQNLAAACVPEAQNPASYGLSGKGVLVGILDSGVDFTRPIFQNLDKTTKIRAFWDQTASGQPPAGFSSGTEYMEQQLNEWLAAPPFSGAAPDLDTVGHGTAVANIVADVAPGASFLVVRLGFRGGRSTEIMRALKYMYDRAILWNMPLAINLSFGTNNGAHDGHSLFETYIDAMCEQWKSVIAVAAGNEGGAGHHFSGSLPSNGRLSADFVNASGVESLYLSAWKNYADEISFELTAPGGRSTGLLDGSQPVTQRTLGGARISVSYASPTPYSASQEIYIQIRAVEGFLPAGLWRLELTSGSVVDGRVDIWLPTTEEVSRATSFVLSSPDTTLTLPGTAQKVVTVGAYNALLGSAATFSGWGYTRGDIYVKPDLVAPGVNISTTRPHGGLDTQSGTSMAAPFVTGAAALLMEWGIVRGNDPFLYGQKVKAYLHRGARRLSSETYPNPIWGYGSLCVHNALDTIRGT